MKLSHDGAFKFPIRDRPRESKPEGHTDSIVCSKMVEVAFGVIDGPNREEVRQRENDIAEAGFDSEIGCVVFLSC